VTPGQGAGNTVEGIPVYDLSPKAVTEHAIDAANQFCPHPVLPTDACFEIIQGRDKIPCNYGRRYTDHDVRRYTGYAQANGLHVLKAGTAGVISPGKLRTGGPHPPRMLIARQRRPGCSKESEPCPTNRKNMLTEARHRGPNPLSWLSRRP